ncbi:hypothetical protein N8I71_12945 [Roseibacterium sp. SDUM158016]|uniref:hypothetical protein n=1 Tax=Roseicyclus sediminis TaxID=2980997 RepID=UPI0021CFC9A3|nr:hypothetical protein [Roseibacterium sp. SDUM158016]MCU4653744.1 hypothetical protein [Roseibacterium sp. SDUM158016]
MKNDARAGTERKYVRDRGLEMRRVTAAAILLGASMFSAPAYATGDFIVRFCESFLERYDAAVAQYEQERVAGHRIYQARYHYYWHLRTKTQRTADFCRHFLADDDDPVSEASQHQDVVYVNELRYGDWFDRDDDD